MSKSPQEKEALAKLDEDTRDVPWDEFGKEADRELNAGGASAQFFGGLARFGRPAPSIASRATRRQNPSTTKTLATSAAYATP
jgi:hypothetical protein